MAVKRQASYCYTALRRRFVGSGESVMSLWECVKVLGRAAVSFDSDDVVEVGDLDGQGPTV